MDESIEKGKILKEALNIVNELAKCKFEDENNLIHEYYKLDDLVKRAINLKSNHYWKL